MTYGELAADAQAIETDAQTAMLKAKAVKDMAANHPALDELDEEVKAELCEDFKDVYELGEALMQGAAGIAGRLGCTWVSGPSGPSGPGGGGS